MSGVSVVVCARQTLFDEEPFAMLSGKSKPQRSINPILLQSSSKAEFAICRFKKSVACDLEQAACN